MNGHEVPHFVEQEPFRENSENAVLEDLKAFAISGDLRLDVQRLSDLVGSKSIVELAHSEFSSVRTLFLIQSLLDFESEYDSDDVESHWEDLESRRIIDEIVRVYKIPYRSIDEFDMDEH